MSDSDALIPCVINDRLSYLIDESCMSCKWNLRASTSPPWIDKPGTAAPEVTTRTRYSAIHFLIPLEFQILVKGKGERERERENKKMIEWSLFISPSPHVQFTRWYEFLDKFLCFRRAKDTKRKKKKDRRWISKWICLWPIDSAMLPAAAPPLFVCR